MEKGTNSRGAAPDVAAFIGIDWADQKHAVYLAETGSSTKKYSELKQTPEAIVEWVSQLRVRFGGEKIAICLEQSKGALIYALMGYDFLVLYPINPATLAKYREAFTPSKAKDDPTDAELLLELVSQHRDRLKAWKPEDERTRTITMLVEARRKAVDEAKGLGNRIKSLLKMYFPQALDLIGDNPCTFMACDFLLRWPTLKDVKRAKKESVRDFYHENNMRRFDLIEQRLATIKSSLPLTTDKAVIETSVITIRMVASQLRCLVQFIKEYEKRIAETFPQHPDASIFKSFPGAGEALAPRLLAAFGTQRDRHDSCADIQSFSGIAPVTERSGKSVWIHMRWACPKFMKQTFHEFANQSRRFSLWAGAYYDMQRGRGKGHHAAIRSLAFKWIRIIFRCWKSHTVYNEVIYLKALRKRGSSLMDYIANSAGEIPELSHA